jgi:2-C-methyl-D-erythritol 4-phosphate cytidylyltransferase / 2-C-methyl-D-erythritol 2,4-cyclodiphosphate synthase
MSIVALILAAGKGLRSGQDQPKQFARLAGKALVAHSIDAFAAHPLIDHIYVVIGQGQEELLAEALEGRSVAGVVTGGGERHESVQAGLTAIGTASKVLSHDASRFGYRQVAGRA